MFASGIHCSSVLLLFTLVLLACQEPAECRRGSSSSRRSSSRRTIRYQPKPKPQPIPSYPKYNPAPKPKFKTKKGFGGGSSFKTLGTIALGAYIANRMTPSIGFRYRNNDYNRRPSMCMDCMSINGSNVACEKGYSYSSSVGRCGPYGFRSHCSTEYGRTSDDVFFMRRSCNERTCNSCSSHLADFTGDAQKKCYILQCNVCNWNGCNSGSLETTFSEKLAADDGFSGDDEDDGGGGGSGNAISQNTLIITLSLILALFISH